MDYVSKAKNIISNNIYLTIATSSSMGEPWITPVFFAYDDSYNLYWVSQKNTRHSTNIRANPRTAIVIFDSQAPEGNGDGIWLEGDTQELNQEADIKRAVPIYNARVTKDEFKIKSLSDVMNEGIYRIYQAKYKKLYTLKENSDDRIVVNF